MIAAREGKRSDATPRVKRTTTEKNFTRETGVFAIEKKAVLFGFSPLGRTPCTPSYLARCPGPFAHSCLIGETMTGGGGRKVAV